MTAFPDQPREFITDYLPKLLGSAEIGPVTSVGSLTVRVHGAGEWSLRLRDGRLETLPEQEDDVIVQLTMDQTDFGPLIVDTLRRTGGTAPQGVDGGVSRIFALDAQTAAAVRHLPGSILVEVLDGRDVRRVLITPGVRKADVDTAECTLSVAMEDLLGAVSRRESAIQLFLSGKIQITGNVQLAMALGGLFA